MIIVREHGGFYRIPLDRFRGADPSPAVATKSIRIEYKIHKKKKKRRLINRAVAVAVFGPKVYG